MKVIAVIIFNFILSFAPVSIVINLVSSTVPPDISDAESSSDQTVNEGQNALLYCSANGHPMPRITCNL